MKLQTDNEVQGIKMFHFIPLLDFLVEELEEEYDRFGSPIPLENRDLKKIVFQRDDSNFLKATIISIGGHFWVQFWIKPQDWTQISGVYRVIDTATGEFFYIDIF